MSVNVEAGKMAAPEGAHDRRVLKRLAIALTLIAAVLIAAALLIGCAPRTEGPEAIAWDRDTCATCRMHLTQPGFAAEMRDESGVLTKYDDVGCLLRALRGRPQGSYRAWVEDHGARAWVEIERATFVRATESTPMGSGIVAFSDAAAARRLASDRGGAVVPLAKLLEEELPADASIRPAGESTRILTEADAKEGKAIYVRECSACHGERGDGDGPAAAFLEPRPRNFLRGKFKLRTTPSGKPPRTDDVLRTIERGIPGTAMPAFSFLTAEERKRVAAFVLQKADLLDGKEPVPIEDPGAAPPTDDALVARGKQVYVDVGCNSCHGPLGRGDGATAKTLKDDDGRPIPARDFTTGAFRGGDTRQDVYIRFTAGMDGSPMPAFGDTIPKNDRWALVDYVLSLRAPPSPSALPSNPIEAGRIIAAKHACGGCHVLDDGKGGEIGPDLRVSGQKLDAGWLGKFLAAPRDAGKIYPWRPWRMPHLPLDQAEVRAMTTYILAMGKRKEPAASVPSEGAFDSAKVAEGKNLYVLRCTECHNLGKVIETPPVKQQGPDLITVAGRVDYEWAKTWILNPKKIDPKTRMTVPGITAEQTEAVRQFVWKASIEHSRGKSIN